MCLCPKITSELNHWKYMLSNIQFLKYYTKIHLLLSSNTAYCTGVNTMLIRGKCFPSSRYVPAYKTHCSDVVIYQTQISVCIKSMTSTLQVFQIVDWRGRNINRLRLNCLTCCYPMIVTNSPRVEWDWLYLKRPIKYQSNTKQLCTYENYIYIYIYILCMCAARNGRLYRYRCWDNNWAIWIQFIGDGKALRPQK